MHICYSFALEQRLDELYTIKNLLFLETSSDDLYADGKIVYIVGMVVLVRITLTLFRGQNESVGLSSALSTRVVGMTPAALTSCILQHQSRRTRENNGRRESA
jgi:hypothetical protein